MVRAIIECHVKEGKRLDLLPLNRELRVELLHQLGYLIGETLQSIEDANIILLLSTWKSLEHWKAWEQSEQRTKIYGKIEPLLVEKPKASIYQPKGTAK